MGFIFAILFLICILWAIFYFELSRLMATAMIIFCIPLRCYFYQSVVITSRSALNYSQPDCGY